MTTASSLRKNAAAASRVYEELFLRGIGYQQLPELLGDRDEGNAQGSDLDLELRLMSRKSSNVLKRPRAQQIQDGGVHMQSRHPTKLVYRKR
jgi:hypothetical protein